MSWPQRLRLPTLLPRVNLLMPGQVTGILRVPPKAAAPPGKQEREIAWRPTQMGTGTQMGAEAQTAQDHEPPTGVAGTKALTGTEPQRRSFGALGHKTRAGSDPAGEAETKTEAQTERRT